MSHDPDLPPRVERLRSDPQRTILLVPTPAFPSARLLHTLRYYVERYGLAIEVVTATDLAALLQIPPDVFSGRLVRAPATHFVSGTPAQPCADRDALIQTLSAAGAWVHLLPRVPDWGFLVDQLAFLAYLERGVILPPAGHETFAPPPTAASTTPFRHTIATIPAREVSRWH